MLESFLGSLLIVSAPSGGGKTSLVAALVQNLSGIEVSVSHTTRNKRPGEEHGVDYYFIDQPRFETMMAEQAFVEHALVFDHYYGTSVAEIQDRLQAGIDVVLDIDWQGAQQIKAIFADAISVFIVPPSLAVLEQRLRDRQQDPESVIQDRMKRAKDELSHYAEFDYLVVNDRFEQALSELEAIVMARRLSTRRQMVQQRKLLSFLLAEQ